MGPFAGAGSSAPGWLRSGPGWGHPRRCGEQASRPTAAAARLGPSPRARGVAHTSVQCVLHRGAIPGVRGADPQGDRHVHQAGAIPAGAGSSPSSWRRRLQGRGHPRGCGEQPAWVPASCTTGGPSPRVRGAGRGTRPRRHRPGAIPAVRGADSLTCMSAWQQVHHETLSRSPAFQVYGLCDLTTNAPRPSIPFLSTGTVVSTASYRFLAIASNDRK